jgi:sugar/nucleoside kinase (ribokinase family)
VGAHTRPARSCPSTLDFQAAFPRRGRFYHDPVSGALDFLAVGDVAEERAADGLAILGGGAARLAAHAAALGLRTALVAKLGDDDEGRHLRDALERLKVDLRWVRTAPGLRTTVWHQPDGQPQDRRVDRGADLALRLDELPPISVTASLTVVCGYSLSVEPARSAALGALTTARARTGHSALLFEADLLWWTNARMTRRVLEPAVATADSVAMTAADAHALFGPVDGREALRLTAEMGPRLVYLAQADGSVLLRDASRVYACPSDAVPRDRYAGPAAFWAGLAQKSAPRKAALDALRYASSVRRAGAPRPSQAAAQSSRV